MGARKRYPLRAPAKRRASVQPATALNARGLRSRERLKHAAREVLNERGFRSLRVQDVTERAGVANGLFYRYFHDLREIVAEVAQEFFTELVEDTDPSVTIRDPYEWIFDSLNKAIQRFARNPGILACLFGLSGDYAEFDRTWKDNAHNWNLRIAEFLEREAGYGPAHARRMAFVLGAMTEGVIYQALIRRTEDLAEFGGRPQDIADVIAAMWYRAIFLADPPAAKLHGAGRRLIGAQTRGARKKK